MLYRMWELPVGERASSPLHTEVYDYPIRLLASHGSVHLTSQSRIRTTAYGREASRRELAFTRERKSRKSGAKVRKVCARGGIFRIPFSFSSRGWKRRVHAYIRDGIPAARAVPPGEARLASSADRHCEFLMRSPHIRVVSPIVVSIFDSFVRRGEYLKLCESSAIPNSRSHAPIVAADCSVRSHRDCEFLITPARGSLYFYTAYCLCVLSRNFGINSSIVARMCVTRILGPLSEDFDDIAESLRAIRSIRYDDQSVVESE